VFTFGPPVGSSLEPVRLIESARKSASYRSGWPHLAALMLSSVLVLTACGSGSGSSPKTSPGSGTTAGQASIGVAVSGSFDTTPKVTVPGTPAPTALKQQTLIQGSGAVVDKGDTLIANYVGQTWTPKDGKPNVFDSSFARNAPTAFVIGTGQVITGWDQTLVGKKLGSRVLLSVPPADGYGANGQPSAGISATDTLVFVIDLVADFAPNASAPGTVVPNIKSSGLPKIVNVAGQPPTITSAAGVTAPAKPTSTLLVTGRGVKIDPAKSLVLQLVQTDLATGQNTQSTWGKAPQTAPAQDVLPVASVLTGQNVGSRALVLLPPTPATPASATQQAQQAAPAEILLVDVVGQF
jgi:peptidylprolyl isomerase